MNMMNNTVISSRLIKVGHNCLGVVTSDGLTLTATDSNNSLLWSRETGSTAGRHHTWTPWGNGKPTAALPGFNGERSDPVSGAYHLGNGYRAYNPVLRRFNCPDNMSPFGAGGINPYAYCAGDPVNHTDPSGHLSWQGIVGIVAGVIGIAAAVYTAGASVAAAGGVMAALSSASAATLISGSIGLASTATGIASVATEESNPKASSILGWVSFATGISSMPISIGSGISGQVARSRAGLPRKAGLYRKVSNTEQIYASNMQTSAYNLVDALNAIRKVEPNKPITILSGIHGAESGDNWEVVSRKVSQSIIKRRHLISDNYRVTEGIAKSMSNVSVVDMGTLNAGEFSEILRNDSIKILSFCWSRNDYALTGVFGLESKTTLKSIPSKYKWSQRKLDNFLRENRSNFPSLN